MADLIMTIDSDSDVETTAKSKNSKKQKKNAAKTATKPEDEEILLGHTVILQDTDDAPKKI